MLRSTAAWLAGEMVWRSETGTVPLGLHKLPFVSRLKRHFFHLSLINDDELFVPSVKAAFYQRFEEQTIRALADLLRPGMVFIDVGANIGYYTLVAARAVGATGQVHAVEPGPETVGLLRRNIRRHRLRNVAVHAVAAGAENCSRTFFSTEDSGSDGFVLGPYSRDPRPITVQQRRIDDLVSGPVHAVKMDVQGSEMEALDGMSRIFSENRSMIAVIEWSPSCMKAAGDDPEVLPMFLFDQGFQSIICIDDHERSTHSVKDMAAVFRDRPLHYCNILALRD